MLSNSNLLSIGWWSGYTLLGVWAQRFVPGVDFLAPGIVLALQKEYRYGALWLMLVWILLQEGMGSLPFGYGVAWYGMLMVFYAMGRWLFEARSILFMCLLGIALGGMHIFLGYSLARLAKLHVIMDTLLWEGMIQAVTFAGVWVIIDALYPKRLRHNVKPL